MRQTSCPPKYLKGNFSVQVAISYLVYLRLHINNIFHFNIQQFQTDQSNFEVVLVKKL